MRRFFVYLMSNKSRTLYTGVTNNLERRVWEHKQKLVEGFSKRYNTTWLVCWEEYLNPHDAIAREKQIKGWVRRRKIELIESMNPGWKDLADGEFTGRGDASAGDPLLRSG